jgi:Flp pilus assembly pilin Flp
MNTTKRCQENHTNERGQGLVEYALILTLVGLIAVGALTVLGSRVGNVFSNVNTGITNGAVAALPGDGSSALDLNNAPEATPEASPETTPEALAPTEEPAAPPSEPAAPPSEPAAPTPEPSPTPIPQPFLLASPSVGWGSIAQSNGTIQRWLANDGEQGYVPNGSIHPLRGTSSLPAGTSILVSVKTKGWSDIPGATVGSDGRWQTNITLSPNNLKSAVIIRVRYTVNGKQESYDLVLNAS